MDLGQRLLEYRKSKNLSQEEVAEKLNVTRQTISKWETGQSTPDFDKIIPICNLYGITSDELITGEKEEIELENKTIQKNDNSKYRALGIVIGIIIYIISIAWLMIAIPVLNFNPIVSSAIFLILCACATGIIIYTCMVYKKAPKEELTKEQKIIKKINDVLAIIFTIIYFAVSFITMAWHITWIIWVIYGLLSEIVKLIFMLKENNYEE